MRQLQHHEVPRTDRTYPITLCLPDWTDPLNVGAAFRLADAAGLAGIVLGGTTPQPPHPRIRKTARSTERTVPWTYAPDVVAYLGDAAQSGTSVVALELTDRSTSLLGATPGAVGEMILVAGNESNGIPADVLAHCHHSVHLPMHGQNSSMNVSVALGAAVYLLLVQFQ